MPPKTNKCSLSEVRDAEEVSHSSVGKLLTLHVQFNMKLYFRYVLKIMKSFT